MSHRNRNLGIASIIIILLLLLWLWPAASPGNSVTITGVAPYMTSGGTQVQFTYSISTTAPYYTSPSGQKIVFVGVTEQLFSSTGQLLDTTYFGSAQYPPGATTTANFFPSSYTTYPGIPHGSYTITMTPYVCPTTPIGPFTGCSLAGPKFTGLFNA